VSAGGPLGGKKQKTRLAYVSDTGKYILICTEQRRAYVHVLRNRNAYLNVFRIKIQTDTYRYELPLRVHNCMYLHVCGLNISDIQTHMHRIQSIGMRDTGTYRRIQQCAYVICTVYIGYALDCIVCICACISVCIFFRYIQDISVHIRVLSVCIFGRYAHAGSLMSDAPSLSRMVTPLSPLRL
jgi:hypothetical protein